MGNWDVTMCPSKTNPGIVDLRISVYAEQDRNGQDIVRAQLSYSLMLLKPAVCLPGGECSKDFVEDRSWSWALGQTTMPWAHCNWQPTETGIQEQQLPGSCSGSSATHSIRRKPRGSGWAQTGSSALGQSEYSFTAGLVLLLVWRCLE
jgi:hypothetical protein